MPPEPAVGSVHGIARPGLQHTDKRIDDFGRGEELAGLRPGVVRELLDQIFVGAAENVGRHALVRQIVLAEMLDQRMDDLVGDQRLAGTVRRGLVPVHREDAAQFLVGLGDGAHRLGQDLAEIERGGLDVAPAGAVGDREAMLAAPPKDRLLRFREAAPLLPLQFGNRLVGLAFPLVAQALVEHQREDIVLVVLTRGFAPQDIGGAPEMRFELLLSQLSLVSFVGRYCSFW